MMNVSEYASDVGVTVKEILELCNKLDIKVSKEDDMLSDDDIIILDNELASIQPSEESTEELEELEELEDIEESYEEQIKEEKQNENNQKLIEEPIYIFSGYYDASEECYGPCFGDPDNYLYGIYENIRNNGYSNGKKEIPKKDIDKFEKDKIIIYSKKYVHSHEIRRIFEEELLNAENKKLNDCVVQTKNRIEKLNYIRSPEYKEKILLDRINELYKKLKVNLFKKKYYIVVTFFKF